MTKISLVIQITTILLALLISACDKPEHAAVTSFTPTAITSADACHICGMDVANFPGPKGQAFIQYRDKPLKFCSTVDLFSWLLQPDTTAILKTAYVHDMGASPDWHKPDDSHYIDVKAAWYVISKTRTGAMGPTLVSFRQKQAAQTFIKEHGGELIRYADINFDLLLKLQLSHIPQPEQNTIKP